MLHHVLDYGNDRVEAPDYNAASNARTLDPYGGHAEMQTGIVRWFNGAEGIGSIEPVGGSNDVFVHISAVHKAGLNTLEQGQTIHYEALLGKNGNPSVVTRLAK